MARGRREDGTAQAVAESGMGRPSKTKGSLSLTPPSVSPYQKHNPPPPVHPPHSIPSNSPRVLTVRYANPRVEKMPQKNPTMRAP